MGDKSSIREGLGSCKVSSEVRPDNGDRSEISLFSSKISSFKLVICPKLIKSPSVSCFPVKSNSSISARYSSPAIMTIGANGSAAAVIWTSSGCLLTSPVPVLERFPLSHTAPAAKRTAAAAAAPTILGSKECEAADVCLPPVCVSACVSSGCVLFCCVSPCPSRFSLLLDSPFPLGSSTICWLSRTSRNSSAVWNRSSGCTAKPFKIARSR